MGSRRELVAVFDMSSVIPATHNTTINTIKGPGRSFMINKELPMDSESPETLQTSDKAKPPPSNSSTPHDILA